MKSRVALLTVSPATILSDVDRLVDLAGISHALAPARTTILKDNISWHFPFPGANTTPWQLEGTIQALATRGFSDLVCVQNKTVVTDVFKGEDLNHYLPILRRYEVPVRYNFRPEDTNWVRYEPKSRMRALHRVFPDGIHVPEFFLGKNIVHLPTVKCHIYTTTTGAMKNAFGGLLNTHRHYTHSWIHETLVDLLAIQREIHSGLFAIMDGTTAGNGPGPRTMKPVVKNVMLASPDQVAVDAVSAKLMGFDPMSIPYIRLAHEDGLGTGDPREIEIVGDEAAAREDWHFRVGKNLVRVGGGDLIWFGPLKPFQKLFFHTPLVHAFVLASEIYHDLYRWPLVDRREFTRWCEATEWGRLFLRYAQMGPMGAPPTEAPPVASARFS
jgi:uncharacterized protein (DUF362 family)